jgi:myo-inositol-1(or 4)-monophosphatase
VADRVGASYSAMAKEALYVRISVPVTHQLAQVAAGRMDLHWQYDNVRAHAAALRVLR